MGEDRKMPDTAHRRMPLVTLVRTFGGFKMSTPQSRQDRLLATLDPLALGKSSTPQLLSAQQPEPYYVQEDVWGDQEPLSKIPFKILSGHDHVVSSCHFCVDDTKLLSGSYDSTVKLWDAFGGSVDREFENGPEAPVVECSVSADSRRVIAASYDKTVRAWDVETGQLLWKISHNNFIVSCKLSPDGKYVVCGLDVDRGLCITDTENMSTVAHIKDHHQRSLTACCFDPDSQRVASVSLDRSIKIWDITSQATLLTIPKAHANAISNCCFTFSGHFLCTSSWDKSLKIWNVHTGEFRNTGACVTLMRGHEGSVSSCFFARDSSFLISGGFDKTVAIWDVGEGYRKLALKGHKDWVMDVAISRDKKWILSASKDRTMRIWNIEEIDEIPLVIKYRKAMGLKLQQCEGCDKPFSVFESDSSSELFTKCVFCRMEARDLEKESSSLSEERSQDH
ncbi:WD repeat-containing protein 88 [Ochotona curzoniae]|uniref:WD repeat-containing protein 88 n=1 Tax=Ochotona curzoniae TaxID=130825 RepID=UPI001B348399|nr:WD repeat-containing protein 88 [Ochotona curzoniae]